MFYKIIIIDYGLGNIRSAQKSIQATLKKNNFNGTVEISSDKKKLSDATHIILPGQGSFEHCINGLKIHFHMHFVKKYKVFPILI